MHSSSVIVAVKIGNNKRLKSLLEEKADVNSTDPSGVSALMWAANAGIGDVFKTLLENKADINYQDKMGNTALAVAKHYKSSDIIELLREHEAKISKQPKEHAEELLGILPVPLKDQPCRENKKNTHKSLRFSLADTLKELEIYSHEKQKRREEENLEEMKDLRNMYARLLDFGDTEEFDAIHYTAKTGKFCTTIDAHYRNPNFRIHDQENVCRTTITASGFPIKYIEYRMTPEMNLGEDSNGTSYRPIPETFQWVIAFKTKEEAAKYKKFIPYLEKYAPHLFNKSVDFSNVFCLRQKCIDRTLNQLVEKGCCPEEAVKQQKEQLKENNSFSFHL